MFNIKKEERNIMGIKEIMEGIGEVEWRKLGEVAAIKTGKGITKKDGCEDGEYPIISGGVTPMGFYDKYNREGMTVTISRVGANAGYVDYQYKRFYLNDKCFSVIPTGEYAERINARFLYHYLKNIEREITSLQAEGGVPTINIQKLSTISIPVPSLNVQRAIADYLDRYEELEAELERELELRGKEKVYVRERIFGELRVKS